VRRYFGGWEKADKKIPATFRQPDAPLSEKQIIELPNIEEVEVYQASRYMARNNKDYQAGLILAGILFERLKNSAADVQISDVDFQTNIFIRNETHLLDGSFVIGVKLPADKASAFIEKTRQPFLLRKISDAEFEKSKTSRISEMNQTLSEKTALAELWLNADTYQLISIRDEISKLNSVTLADVQRVAENLQKQTVVNVIVNKEKK
jgi:predicted Zn-dependent peptidase